MLLSPLRFTLCNGQRNRPVALSRLTVLRSLIATPPMLPPEDDAKNDDHQIDPVNHQPLLESRVNVMSPLLPTLADLQKAFRIVGDDAVQSMLDAPFHEIVFINRPIIDRPSLSLRVSQEPRADDWCNERLLKDVEGDVGREEELAGVGNGEANVGYGKCREIL